MGCLRFDVGSVYVIIQFNKVTSRIKKLIRMLSNVALSTQSGVSRTSGRVVTVDWGLRCTPVFQLLGNQVQRMFYRSHGFQIIRMTSGERPH